jgi:hypothetical protein
VIILLLYWWPGQDENDLISPLDGLLEKEDGLGTSGDNLVPALSREGGYPARQV